MGGGGIINLAEIIVSDLVPLAERGIYQGILGLTWAFASGIGPPIVRIDLIASRSVTIDLLCFLGRSLRREGILEMALLYAPYLMFYTSLLTM